MQFRVDQIHRLRVEQANQEEEIFQERFDREQLEETLNLKSRFKNTLGVWIHYDTDSLHEIEIEFMEWAASYIRHLKFHPSQEIVSEDKPAKKIVIRIRLLMKPGITPDQEIETGNLELAFLLGRFRKYAKVLSIKPVINHS